MTSVTVLKRNLTRSKNELSKLDIVIGNLHNEPGEYYSEAICQAARTEVQKFKERLALYITRRDLVEASLEENQLDAIDTTASDDLYDKLSLWVVKIESRIASSLVKWENEKLDKENKESNEKLEKERQYEREKLEKEREEREKERKFILERQAKEAEIAASECNDKIKLEELQLKKLELEVQNPQLKYPPSTSTYPNHASFLPKIELIKFDGTKPERYSEFWECFASIIDSRSDLTDSLKLQYLKMQVTSKAAKLLDGLKITSANYQVAKELLHEEYGSTQIVTNKLYNDINNLSLVSQKKEDIMKLYSDIETNLKLLENLGNQVEGEVLASCIFKKLAPETKSKLVELYSDKITVSNIRVRMKEELKQQRVLQSLEPCSSVSSKPPPSPHKFGGFQYEKKGYTAESLVARASDSGGGGNNRTIGHCVFCDTQGHFSDECPTYQTIVDRKKMLDRKCHICLRLNHSTPQCRNMARCYHCGVRGSHYRALCPSKFPRGNIQIQNSSNGPSNRYNRPNFRNSNSYPTDKNNSRGSVSDQKNPPVNQQQNTSAHMNDSQETGVVSTSLYSGNSSSPSVVYFQTATIRVKNKEKGKECKVRALFDSGSTYSYITESLKNRLDLGHGGESVNLNMYTFGTDVPKSMNVGKGSVTLLDSQDNPRDIDVCVVPTIIHNHSRSPYDVSFISSLRSLKSQPTPHYVVLPRGNKLARKMCFEYLEEELCGPLAFSIYAQGHNQSLNSVQV
ncbi:hypothetical protein M8J77_008731 [Diaphorina citri]|nr:hypothetical protein M8J77_008731 [Diaphorina citri]